MTLPKAACCWLVFVTTCPIARASAEPIELTRGFFVNDDETTPLVLETATFRVSAAFNHIAFEVLPHEQCWVGACFPGMTFDPGVRTIDPPLNVPWERSTFNGVVYPDLFIDGDITVTGEPAPVPTLRPSEFTRRFVYPVSLSGFVTIFPDSSRTTPLVSAELFGTGSVSILFVIGPDDRVQARSEEYRFGSASAAPVPEPGTMLLAGSGVLALLRVRRRRRTFRASAGPIWLQSTGLADHEHRSQ
jgi:hypothetical protein